MITHISVTESNLSLFYRLTLPNHLVIVCQVTAMPPDAAALLSGIIYPDSALVTPLLPRGTPWAFMPRYVPDAGYVREKLGVPDVVAHLYRVLMPLLTSMSPADLIAEEADRWFFTQP